MTKFFSIVALLLANVTLASATEQIMDADLPADLAPANYDAFASEFVSVSDEVKLLELKVKKKKLVDQLNSDGAGVKQVADLDAAVERPVVISDEIKLIQVSKLQNSGRIVSFVAQGKVYTVNHGGKFQQYKVYIEPKTVVFWAGENDTVRIGF